MSFFSDLFEGNFSNLGTDITHAPSSFANHPAEIAETGAAVLTALTLGAGAGAFGALGAGAEGALGAGELGAGAADLGAGAADLGTIGAGELAADTGLGGAEFAGLGAGAADLGAANSLFGAFSPELGGAEFAGTAGDFATAGGDFAGGGIDAGSDIGAGAADLSTGPDAGATSAATTAPGAPGATPTGAGATPSYVNPSVANAPPSAEMGLANLNSEFGAFTPGGAAASPGGFSSLVEGAGGWGNIAKWGLQGAPLALTLAMGQGGLPSAAQANLAQAQNLSATGQQDLAAARAGQLNAGQTAVIGQMRQDLTNQWRQTLFNQGVTDITKDARWPQIEAEIDAKVTQQTATLIQQNITNALAETGQASAALTSIAQIQLSQDQNFTNQLIGATKSLGLAAALSGSNAPKVQQVINA